MKATEILMGEHRVIERVLNALETAAQRLEEGKDLRPAFFTDAAEFIKGFADGCHHHKEEGVLFKTLVDSGFPSQGGPISVMLMEHEQGRAYTRALLEAAQRLAAGDAAARREVIENARGYASLLRHHIAKEDNILFRMADQALPPAAQDQVLEGFESLEQREEEVHGRYLALASTLEQEVG